MEPDRPSPPDPHPTSLQPNTRTRWQATLFRVIFEHDTPAGRRFDVALILTIGLSVVVVMLESIASIRLQHEAALHAAEWVFTALFTVEYALRLACVRRPSRYAGSFFGVIDLLAILPTYLSLFVPGAQFLLVIRTLRFLRIFRILKLVQYLSEADVLGRALWASRRKILIFLLTVITLDTIFGALMYVIESGQNGFDSIPRSIYWAIVTLTTVGYGDISPVTNLGQFVAAIIMITGYAIIAVPTGIVTAELARAQHDFDARACSACGSVAHAPDAVFCRHCAERLPTSASPDSAS